ncbi:hypothetical protein [Parasegetibacter sp. NRK P23]|uniref:hypothetical protein n=1 Tax=Parasegetibacter sp. NRK P23 TaxID=2942999 RepID=UPI00204407C2|nr:hypothetical protein [Parasegetibacter sp. NRK P23]MCM5528190.1 hypothetical protein [Parasegetibacter sp. NRK P23]
MPVSAFDLELLRYFNQLEEDQKKSILDLVMEFVKLNKKSVLDEGTLSAEDYNKELSAAVARIKNGAFITLEELENEMKGW